MPKLYFDTNTILDFTLKRAPFFDSVRELLDLVEAGKVEAFTSVLCIVHAHYHTRREFRDERKVRNILAGLLTLVRPVAIPAGLASHALSQWEITDFEDSVQWAICQHHEVDFLITHNQKDFPTSGGITVCDAETYLLLHAKS